MNNKTETQCLFFDEYQTASDMTTWLNFKHREHEQPPFSLIEVGGRFVVVTQDVKELYLNPHEHYRGLVDYHEWDSELIEDVIHEPDSIPPWKGIHTCFQELDSEILLFIMITRVPLQLFVQHELISRADNEDQTWKLCENYRALWHTCE